jgi:hypothetical protein
MRLPDSVEKAISVDSDTFFLTDPAILGPRYRCIDPVPSKPGYRRMLQRLGDLHVHHDASPRQAAFCAPHGLEHSS